MSIGKNTINMMSRVISSNSFKNFSSFYFKYLVIAGGIGGGIGVTLSFAHLLDCKKKYYKEIRKANAKGLNTDDIEENSYLYSAGILVTGPLIGTSLGTIWPVVVVIAPLYYAFGDYLGPIVQSLLALSLVVSKDDFKSNLRNDQEDDNKED